jgi:prepilin-type N-terminal cleavage/methylation domain-containing protein
MNISDKKGFTLVELIVAIGVFLSIIAIASGIFIRSVRTQRFVNDAMAMNSNASLALEQIMREIRSGFNFEVCELDDCQSSGFGDTLKFTRVRGDTTVLVTYGWNQTDLNIERTEGTLPVSVLTASNVKVDRLSFSLFQADSLAPWRISLFLKVGSKNDPSSANTVDLQTSVSARILPSEAL